MSDYEHLIYEQRGPVTVITIKRPERMNTIGPKTHRELIDAWDRFRSDDTAASAQPVEDQRRRFAGVIDSPGSRLGYRFAMAIPRVSTGDVGAEASDSLQAAYFRGALADQRALLAAEIAKQTRNLGCLSSRTDSLAISRLRRQIRANEAAHRDLDRMIAAIDRRSRGTGLTSHSAKPVEFAPRVALDEQRHEIAQRPAVVPEVNVMNHGRHCRRRNSGVSIS